jgi:hypothetical protein
MAASNWSRHNGVKICPPGASRWRQRIAGVVLGSIRFYTESTGQAPSLTTLAAVVPILRLSQYSII